MVFPLRVMFPKLKSLIIVGILALTACSALPIRQPEVTQPVLDPAPDMTPAQADLSIGLEETAPASPVPTSTPLLEPTSTPAPTQRPDPLPMPIIGVENYRLGNNHLDLMVTSEIFWMRRNSLLWSKVEPQEGERAWSNQAALETDLKAAAEQGINVVLIVRSTPPWAQLSPPSYCGPVIPEKLEAFARFLQDAVTRYSVPPFNVKYWELGNEPDVDPSLVPFDNVYGCWGDENDPYYGGEYYAEMLRIVYPAIKAVNPDAQIVIGGLLLNCDPKQSAEVESKCKSAHYLEGILRNGGGKYFDYVSYHGYPQFSMEHILDIDFPSWEKRGGVVLGKYFFIQEVLAEYGVDKPVLHTEGALLCPDWNTQYCNPAGDVFFEAQADYVVWLYVRNWAAGIAGTFWHQLEGPGWREGGLLDRSQEPRPALHALQFLMDELGDSYFIHQVELYHEMEGYGFSAPDKQIWVLWARDEKPHEIILPDGFLRAYDKYGSLLETDGFALVIDSPVYLELAP